MQIAKQALGVSWKLSARLVQLQSLLVPKHVHLLYTVKSNVTFHSSMFDADFRMSQNIIDIFPFLLIFESEWTLAQKPYSRTGWHGIQGILFVNILLRKNNREQDKKGTCSGAIRWQRPWWRLLTLMCTAVYVYIHTPTISCPILLLATACE